MSETGHNEKIVGKAIKDRREDVVLATKLFIGTGEARRSAYDAIRKYLEASLKRLQTDYHQYGAFVYPDAAYPWR